MAPNPVASLLDKYPHLRMLASKRLEEVTKHCDSSDKPEEGGRISLLGPGVVREKRQTPDEPPASTTPRGRVVAEDLFAASVAADDDHWLQFQVNADVPASDQLDSLKLWLVSNKPSTIARSTGVGWIAVKFKDKGKKVLEAKAAWDSFEGEKTMEVVNRLAMEFKVKGGKWMCHLPSALIDEVWGKLATALMCGGLGPTVYMVKVSPVEDIDPNLSRGEHVICVYNMDYQDTDQVMRVENLVRSAGVSTVLNYKPDIFSALGIYRNNKWGFRPTIYSSKVTMMEGKSRVETVGTGKWYYNSSKGLQYPSSQEISNRKMSVREVKPVNVVKSNKVKIDKNGSLINSSSGLSSMSSAKKVENRPQAKSQVADELKQNKGLIGEVSAPLKKKDINSNSQIALSMKNLDLTKRKENNVEKKSGWSHRLAPKKSVNPIENTDDVEDNEKNSELRDETNSTAVKLSSCKGWSHRLTSKQGNDRIDKTKEEGQRTASVDPGENTNTNATVTVVTSSEHPPVKKPLWLMKLEQIKLKNMEDMKSK